MELSINIEGQVSIWNVLQKDGSYSPNYRDIFPNAEESQVPNCREGGVIPTSQEW
jgi:adenylyltransferase/sulfurtransferase